MEQAGASRRLGSPGLATEGGACKRPSAPHPDWPRHHRGEDQQSREASWPRDQQSGEASQPGISGAKASRSPDQRSREASWPWDQRSHEASQHRDQHDRGQRTNP
ncbi:hypothetical protein MDA_GLEAN10004456 [Myotis davidii]|uniref:Uncharacterized protein n=1 Tax=Myotis davidii TaxID=225400 RepID=L5LQQ3_MYODS|nr:hypothetical protein MDA_GLEAN10004456 [Myotis davidii]